jgi:hypothetical protein
MKSRRGFLAALGLGAGATVFGLPTTAQAWGRLRRRRDCAPSSPCEMHPSEMRIFSQTIINCTSACPINCYAFVNGIYYYRCYCCPQGGYCDAPSQTPLTPTTGCGDPNCIHSSRILYPYGEHTCICQNPPRRVTASSITKAKFYLDSTAKDQNGNLHAKAFRDGMDSTDTGDNVLAALKNWKNVPGIDPEYNPKNVDVQCVGCVSFKMPSGPNRPVALYTLTITFNDPNSGDLVTNADHPLRIGLEVTKAPKDYPNPTEVNPIGSLSELPRYYVVKVSELPYHCVTLP